jgi:hypothetical protein
MIKKTILFLIFLVMGALIPQYVYGFRPVLMDLIMPIHIFVILIYPEVMFLLSELLLYVYFISIFVHVTKHEFMNLIISLYISKFVVLILFFIAFSTITAREIINVYEYSNQLLWGFTHVPIISLIVLGMKKLNLVSLNEKKTPIEW